MSEERTTEDPVDELHRLGKAIKLEALRCWTRNGIPSMAMDVFLQAMLAASMRAYRLRYGHAIEDDYTWVDAEECEDAPLTQAESNGLCGFWDMDLMSDAIDGRINEDVLVQLGAEVKRKLSIYPNTKVKNSLRVHIPGDRRCRLPRLGGGDGMYAHRQPLTLQWIDVN